ncbi:YbaB/EbfC family nucleoid-associated protein [Nocardia sp. IBHARD005]|uniref:YbaB/EbfC family nucleoid-associated protein n=1 Tax=Nocardia sp. IBHARD005 TaxID=3457765 RepID=UPI004059E156
MANEHNKAELATAIDEFQQQMAVIADIQQRRAELVATGTALRKRVSVTVNGDGVVIETQLDLDLDDYTPSEIGKAVTEAAQTATAELGKKNAELMAPIQQRRDRMPKMSDLIEGLPDLTGSLPQPVTASITPPNAPERARTDEPTMEFDDVEQLEDLQSGQVNADTRW